MVAATATTTTGPHYCVESTLGHLSVVLCVRRFGAFTRNSRMLINCYIVMWRVFNRCGVVSIVVGNTIHDLCVCMHETMSIWCVAPFHLRFYYTNDGRSRTTKAFFGSIAESPTHPNINKSPLAIFMGGWWRFGNTLYSPFTHCVYTCFGTSKTCPMCCPIAQSHIK